MSFSFCKKIKKVYKKCCIFYNICYNEDNKEQEVNKMKKEMSKSTLMKNAWKLAGMKAKELGGKPVEYISYGLKEAWRIFFQFTGKKRASEKRVEQNIDWSQVKLYGRMTEKQERFIASLLAKGKHTDNPVAKAFQISSLRHKISKQQASDLIKDLLSA